jgi:hypothetical protein
MQPGPEGWQAGWRAGRNCSPGKSGVAENLRLCGASIFLIVVKEALINSSLNYQSTQNKKCDFCFASFSMITIIENGGTSLCRGNFE